MADLSLEQQQAIAIAEAKMKMAQAQAKPEQGNMYTQGAQDIVYSPEGIPLTTSSYGSAPTGATRVAQRALETTAGLPVSYATGAAKPVAGISQLVSKLFGSNAGDVPVQAVNTLEKGIESTSAAPVLNKVSSFAGEMTPLARTNSLMGVPEKIGAIPSYAKNIVGGSLVGGATGLVTPEQTGLSPEEFAKQKAQNVALSSTVGGVIPPLASKASDWAGKLASQLLGMSTGVGAEPIKEAFRAGVKGGNAEKQFTQHLREEVPKSEILDIANQNLTNMKNALGAEYRSGMVDISKDKSILKFDDIDNALSSAKQNFAEYKGKVHNEDIAKILDSVKKKVDNWKSGDPAEFHTPEAMDMLKRSINQDLQKIPVNEKDARKAVGEVYNSVKDTIVNQAPTYAKVMKKYGEGAELIDEMARTFSLKEGALPDTAMRKIQSLMRNNVNTDYGARLELAKKLQEMGGNDLMASLAGQSLSSPIPRGIFGKGADLYALMHATAEPISAAATALATSPKMVGEGALAAGKIARPIYNLSNSPQGEEAQKLARLLMIKAAQGARNE